ncbi:MAG: hypothetical protein QOF62_193 [Pyrinomonadaceae bacterium]|jgi:hypothetical protein|nr:hypothetical protein [Pyrinomonadaceae bacterium]
MSPQQQSIASFTKRLLFLIILGAASISVIKGMYVIGQSQSNEPSDERKFKVKEFKDMPVAVKVKNLQSKTWHKDLEIEVKNISDKPIYFILAYLIFPDDKVADGEVGIPLTFGKRENIQIIQIAEPGDPHIEPGEVYAFTIPEPFRTNFEGRHKRYPNLDKNLLLRFAVISFGDGTGFEVGEPRDLRGRKVSVFEGSSTQELKKTIQITALFTAPEISENQNGKTTL